MTSILQVAGLGWIFFSIYLILKMQKGSRIFVDGQMYIKSDSIMVIMVIIAYSIIVGMAIF